MQRHFLSIRDLLLQDSEKPSKRHFVGITFFVLCPSWFNDQLSESWGGPPALLQTCVPQALELSWPPAELIWGMGGTYDPNWRQTSAAVTTEQLPAGSGPRSLPDPGNSTTGTREGRRVMQGGGTTPLLSGSSCLINSKHTAPSGTLV